MSLEKIVSIPGMSGLYKIVAPLRHGGNIAESLIDKKRFPLSITTKVTALKDISVFTIEGEIPLKEVFLKMKEHNADVSKLSSKSEPDELKAALKKFVPNYDTERVRVSDIRKMVSWYWMLKDIVDFTEEEIKEEVKTAEEAVAPTETSVEATSEIAKPKAKTPKAKKAETEKPDEGKPVARKKAAKKSAS